MNREDKKKLFGAGLELIGAGIKGAGENWIKNQYSKPKPQDMGNMGYGTSPDVVSQNLVKPQKNWIDNSYTTPLSEPVTPAPVVVEDKTPDVVAPVKKKEVTNANSFEGWYKSNFGIDYDPSIGENFDTSGLTNRNADIGRALYQQYLAENTIKGNYDSAINRLDTNYNNQREGIGEQYDRDLASLEQQRDIDEAQAHLLNAKIMKYLPQYLRSRGLAGSGFSESAMLDAGSDYANRLGNVAVNYGRNKSQLDTNRSSQLDNLLNAYNDRVAQAQTDYDNRIAQSQIAGVGAVNEINDRYNRQEREDRLIREEQERIEKAKEDEKKRVEADEKRVQEQNDNLEKQTYLQTDIDTILEKGESAETYNEILELVKANEDIFKYNHHVYERLIDVYTKKRDYYDNLPIDPTTGEPIKE